jgi:hypothetical protein
VNGRRLRGRLASRLQSFWWTPAHRPPSGERAPGFVPNLGLRRGPWRASRGAFRPGPPGGATERVTGGIKGVHQGPAGGPCASGGAEPAVRPQTPGQDLLQPVRGVAPSSGGMSPGTSDKRNRKFDFRASAMSALSGFSRFHPSLKPLISCLCLFCSCLLRSLLRAVWSRVAMPCARCRGADRRRWTDRSRPIRKHTERELQPDRP